MNERIKLNTTLSKESIQKLEDIAKDKDLRSRGGLDKGKAIMYLIDYWEEHQNELDHTRRKH